MMTFCKPVRNAHQTTDGIGSAERQHDGCSI